MFAVPASIWYYGLTVTVVGIGFAFTSQARVYILQTMLPNELMGQGFSFSAVRLYTANLLSLALFAFIQAIAGLLSSFLITSIPNIAAG